MTFLTHYRLAMPFDNREKYFRGSFQLGIGTIKNISSLCKLEISLFKHFLKLKNAHFNEKIHFNFS